MCHDNETVGSRWAWVWCGAIQVSLWYPSGAGLSSAAAACGWPPLRACAALPGACPAAAVRPGVVSWDLVAVGWSYSIFGKCQTSMRRIGSKQKLEGPVNLRELFRDLCLSVFLSRLPVCPLWICITWLVSVTYVKDWRVDGFFFYFFLILCHSEGGLLIASITYNSTGETWDIFVNKLTKQQTQRYGKNVAHLSAPPAVH